MAYYVPLGPRGFLLRIGTSLIGVLHGLIYWHSSRRRRISALQLPVKIRHRKEIETAP